MKVIVDSGSTKTAWYVMSEPSAPMHSFLIGTAGINPVRDDESSIRDVIRQAGRDIAAEGIYGRSSFSLGDVSSVYFYGAGCLPSLVPMMERLLGEVFAGAEIEVASDLLGAARALCGHREGIACILGTGANSCLYDGRHIVANTPALGWILGDEGSGAVLGRQLVGDVLKGQLPKALCDDFLGRFSLTQAKVIEAVYRSPQPNRFLASLVPFLADHRGDEAIRRLLVQAFRAFFVRNVVAYGRRDLDVNFVGGVAAQFEDELRCAAELEAFSVGTVLKEPIHELGQYHAT